MTSRTKRQRNILRNCEKAARVKNERRTFTISNAKKRLVGSRFRKINEDLYTSTSGQNFINYSTNPGLFHVYHEGYREQISRWPYNPLVRVIEWLEEVDCGLVIGDFGCGEARIAQSFPDRKVHSFDLVAGNSFITPCNIAKVPLKDDSLDISIFCLSLMGRDWPLFILEGTRCLKKGGTLKIVEVMSRFKNLTSFIAFIRSLGYEKINEKPNNSDYFIFLQFELKRKKVEKGLLILDEISTLLLPCPYKRR